LRFNSLLRRRPSPAIAISSVALFMSLGGVGYAATQLPANSVGANQIRNNAVTYKKIQAGAVGTVRANTKQLQERVYKICAANAAIAAIAQNGNPTCNTTLPAETGTTSNTASVPTTATGSTAITSTTLAAGSSYLAIANPDVTVTGASGATTGTRVNVSCTLTVGSNTQTRTVTLDTGAAPSGSTTFPASAAEIPLQLTGPAGTASVTCQSSVPGGQFATGTTAPAAPAVSVTSSLNAIQIAG
jgi:hypothetical protein